MSELTNAIFNITNVIKAWSLLKSNHFFMNFPPYNPLSASIAGMSNKLIIANFDLLIQEITLKGHKMFQNLVKKWCETALQKMKTDFDKHSTIT